jgi:hypothetical protein
MKLIATLGATPVGHEHVYVVDNQTYKAKISPLALKEHFNIEDENVYIIGTKKTKEVLGDLIETFNFVEINENSLENVFETAVKYLEKGDVVDLTQGFRSIPFGMFLALNFSKVMDKDPYDVYYAQMQKSDCNYRVEVCFHNFISLKKYLEIGDLAREINSFVTSWYVTDYDIDNFKNITLLLNAISKKLLSNDLDVLKDIENIKKEISKIKNVYSYLEEHLNLLLREIDAIKTLLLINEDYRKFYKMAKKYFEKGLMLQTLTMLFESINAYLAEIVPNDYYCIKNDRKYYKNSKNKYAFRNCVKNQLRHKYSCQKWYFKKLKNCNEFRDKFMQIDEMRNGSAHAFINGKTLDNYYKEIKALLEFFGKYMQ